MTWTREISAILARRCVSCHRPGGYASFPLTTYDEVRPWAVAIKEEILAGHMPPWGAAPGVGQFANDRRLTRHELELVAAWVDGGAPYSLEARTPAFLAASSTPDAPPKSIVPAPVNGGVVIPLAPATVSEPGERVATTTLQLPQGMTLSAWSFEPGLAASVSRVDLELAARWIGTWTPGDPSVEFPSDTGAPLASPAVFTARINYRAPAAPAIDHSRLRVWMEKDARPKSIREVTVVRTWRAPAAVELVAVRPARDDGDVQVLAHYANGHAEAVGALSAPRRGVHPMYRLARPLALTPGARVETTAPVRLLYSASLYRAGATRTVKPNVRRRPRR